MHIPYRKAPVFSPSSMQSAAQKTYRATLALFCGTLFYTFNKAHRHTCQYGEVCFHRNTYRVSPRSYREANNVRWPKKWKIASNAKQLEMIIVNQIHFKRHQTRPRPEYGEANRQIKHSSRLIASPRWPTTIECFYGEAIEICWNSR